MEQVTAEHHSGKPPLFLAIQADDLAKMLILGKR